MIAYLKKRVKKIIRDMNYQNAYSNAAALCNTETFAKLKNCNAGKAVALCGGGPTLKEYQMIPNTMHVALNRALLNENVKYDWFIADDWEGVFFFKDFLKNYNCRKFFGHQIGGEYSRQIPESFRLECGADRYYTDSYLVGSGYNSRLNCDIDKLPVGNMPNIALSAMQIILYTNPKTIYLVGCDASQGHYVQPENLSAKDIARHEKDLKMAVSGDRVIECWHDLKEFAATFYPDTEIVSVNPVGLKGIFRDEYQTR